MRYVQRDAQGNIVGTFANPQTGFAEETVEQDNPELMAFEHPIQIPSITRTQCLLWLWRKQQKTEADVDTAIAAIADMDMRVEAEIIWKNARDLHHDHPLFGLLAPALGIAPASLPDAFRAAALL